MCICPVELIYKIEYDRNVDNVWSSRLYMIVDVDNVWSSRLNMIVDVDNVWSSRLYMIVDDHIQST
jgi:hypothetical protein